MLRKLCYSFPSYSVIFSYINLLVLRVPANKFYLCTESCETVCGFHVSFSHFFAIFAKASNSYMTSCLSHNLTRMYETRPIRIIIKYFVCCSRMTYLTSQHILCLRKTDDKYVTTHI